MNSVAPGRFYFNYMEIRNIAIIAHVDHGKTTLVDGLLKQSGTDLGKKAGTEQIMDSNELERERGITIFAKNASVMYKGAKINIIDTPGHADFGGEVERVLNMADGSLLLVDAQEGPMPQTRFVLKKALAIGHKIIVVVNKIDKENARIPHTLDKVLELFVELGATNDQLDFPVVYAAGRLGKAGLEPELASMEDLTPLFDAVMKYIPAPKTEKEGPLQAMVVSISYDNYKGRVGVSRVTRGTAVAGTQVAIVSVDGKVRKAKITTLMTFAGLGKVEAKEVTAGDIMALAGIPDLTIGDTVTDIENPEALPPIVIEKPTVKMVFSVNNSPFAGKEGQYCTSRNISERLMKELDNDVALRVEDGKTPDEFVVSGRGELHLAILIEKMRREGYELQVSRPEVIMEIKDGVTCEPAEDVWIEAPEAYSGIIIERLSARKGELKDMRVEDGFVNFHFFVPTRGLIGFRSEFIIDTKGKGVINALFSGYFPKWDTITANDHGSLIASEAGMTTSYGLLLSQDRGVLFLNAAMPVYEGQVVGQNAKTDDMVVNVCRMKHLNNFRAKTEALTDNLIPPRLMPLEPALEYVGEDELVEVTPKSIRIRKRVLQGNLRK